MSNRLTIDIWSDVMCPWCVIGYKNLEKGLEELDGEIEAEIRWMPFELNPTMSPDGEDQDAHIAKKYGRSPEQASQTRGTIRDLADRAGFSLSWTGDGDAPPPMMWNTNAAHRLLRWVLESEGGEAQTRLKLGLFRAHFQQRRNISDPEVLADVAQSEGFDRIGALAALTDDRIASTVAWEEDRAQDMMITGVPAMLVNGKMIIPGAQQPEVYVAALRQAVARGL